MYQQDELCSYMFFLASLMLELSSMNTTLDNYLIGTNNRKEPT